MTSPAFQGLRVLSLESRRAAEMAKLISLLGGQPVAAPALREVAFENQAEVREFLGRLCGGELDWMIFLTGAGLRRTLELAGPEYSPAQLAHALRRIRVLARGPKPAAELRRLGVEPTLIVPEPHTWREVISSLDAAVPSWPGLRVGVQEYGQPADDCLRELERRGARIHVLRLYSYQLPEDLAPLRAAIQEIVAENITVILFTSSQQAIHLLRVAADMGLEAALRRALARCVLASIGPTTSQTLRDHGLIPDLQPGHPHMGFLVRAAAEQAEAILRGKRGAIES